MRTATFANLRVHWQRLVAVTLAIAIASAFVAATVVLGGTVQASINKSVGADYEGSELVVQATDGSPTSPDVEQLQAVRAVDGVDAAAIVRLTDSTVTFADGDESLSVLSPIQGAPLAVPPVIEGKLPTSPSEATLDALTAQAHDVGVGDTVQLDTAQFGTAQSGTAQSDAGDGKPKTVTITAIVEVSPSTNSAGWVQLGFADDAFSELTGITRGWAISVAVVDGASIDKVRSAIADAVGSDFEVITTEAAISSRATQTSGDALVLQSVLGLFVVVSLVVCMLVVSNTFQVLIAQRTRELALLRVLGAKRGSVFRAVVFEALVVGLIASVVGLGFGTGVMALLLSLGADVTAMPSSAVFSMPGATAPLAIGAGVLVALVASLAPARAATKIAPLAALRPLDEASTRTGAGRARLIAGIALLLIGAGMLAWTFTFRGDFEGGTVIRAFGIAVAGTLVSALGVVLVSVFVLPGIIRAIGALFGRKPAARLAALNATRNPRRSTATAMALLIGVTLVSTVVVGGEIAKTTIAGGISARFPVDVVGVGEAGGTLSDAAYDEIAREQGVVASLPLTLATVEDQDGNPVQLYAADASRLNEVLAVTPGVLDDDTAFVPWDSQARRSGVMTLQSRDAHGDIAHSVELSTTSIPEYAAGLFVDSSVLDELDVPAPMRAEGVLVDVDEALGPQGINDLATEIQQQLGDRAAVEGAVLMRLQIETVVNIVMMVVTGLLAIAVLIALIGVANTLSLSVIERTRENSLLRALGMSKRSLRGMLAIEAVLMAAVATVVGIVLGTLYGWIGASSVLGAIGTLQFGDPWLQLAAVLGVAVVAGLLASLAPARRATRLSPVEGLAQE